MPEGVALAPNRQPCPACATENFLSLAWARAVRVNSACACNNCIPRQGVGTAGFKIAYQEAFRVSPHRAQAWLDNLELAPSLDD